MSRVKSKSNWMQHLPSNLTAPVWPWSASPRQLSGQYPSKKPILAKHLQHPNRMFLIITIHYILIYQVSCNCSLMNMQHHQISWSKFFRTAMKIPPLKWSLDSDEQRRLMHSRRRKRFVNQKSPNLRCFISYLKTLGSVLDDEENG